MQKSLLLTLVLTISSSAYAFLDYCQDIVLPTGYAFADEKFPLCNFENGLSVVSYQDTNTKRFGFANEQGQIVIAPEFEEAYNFQEGLALVLQNGKYGYINPMGRFVVSPTFSDAWGFSDGLAKVSVSDKIGFINQQGQIVIAPLFDGSQDWFSNGVVAVLDKASKKWGLIDRTGKLITPYAYDVMDTPSDGRILMAKTMAVGKGELRFGYLDLAGNVAITPQFEAAKKFSSKVAKVIQNGKELTINTAGNPIETKMSFDY